MMSSTKSEGYNTEFASNVTDKKIPGLQFDTASGNFRDFSEDPETWVSSCCRITMDETHEQFLSNNCQVSGEDLVKVQSDGNHVVVAGLESQSTLADDWFGQQGGDLTIDSSLEGLFQNEDIADFGTLEPGCVVVTSLQPDVTVLSANNSSSTSASFVAHHGPWLDSESVLTHDYSVDAAGIATHGLTIRHHTDAPDSQCTSSEAAQSRIVSAADQPQQKKDRGVKRRWSESQDDSDGDSQYSDSQMPSNEGLAQFAREFITNGRRTKPYFWQYNVQSRGPKGQRLCSAIEIEDSHVVPDFSDPVFGGNYQLSPWKHSGRARQGDGNDPQPDPKKLLNIGYHIWRLEADFRSIGLDASGDGDNRSLANRQKNKLASRICRLKKKALHAANKIKLDGLKREHGQLMQVLKSIIAEMEKVLTMESAGRAPLCHKLNMLIKNHLTYMIAGHTADYVNAELEKAARELIADPQ